jgi:hypothetical protein
MSNAYFELAFADGVGLADAKTNDLTLFTTLPSQRILLGCGEGSVSAVTIAGSGVVINSAFTVDSLTLSNLTVVDTLQTSTVIASSSNALVVKNYLGPVSLASEGRILMSVDSPSPTLGAFAVSVSGTERLRIGANGFVGVGISPSATLDVGGSLFINGLPFSDGNRSVTCSALRSEGLTSIGGSTFVVDPQAHTAALVGGLSTTGSLTIGSDVSTSGSLTVARTLAVNGNDLVVASGQVGVGTGVPRSALDVAGSIMASSGTLGPIFTILPPLGYTDVQSGQYVSISGEPGNPGAYFGNQTLSDLSGEGATWTRVRFIVRGCLLNTNVATNPSSRMSVHRFSSVTQTYSSATPPFDLPNAGSGFRFFITPWVNLDSNYESYSLYHTSLDSISSFRVGSLYAQFA